VSKNSKYEDNAEYRDQLAIAKSYGERMGEYRPAAPCVTCGTRPRKLPFTQCHICRLPMHRAASQKAWASVKRMRLAREKANVGRQHD
jgi:hypothetical protein